MSVPRRLWSRALRDLIDRPTYANVVATVALFVALGGMSYAAIVLPANSVGPKQLRADAVGLGALRFPLGTVGITDNKIEDLVKGACNSPERLRENAVPPCVQPARGGRTPGREVRIVLQSPGRLLVSAIVNLKDEGAPASAARITLGLNVDRTRVAENEITTAGGQTIQVPIQTFAGVAAGTHTAGLSVSAQYDSAAPGDVLVTDASIIASAAPQG